MGSSSYSSNSSNSQKATTAVIAFLFLAVAVVLVITLGPFNFYKQKVLTIGVLQSEETDVDKRVITAMNAAVDDITKLVSEAGIISKPVPAVSLRFSHQGETVMQAMYRLRNEGVTVFMGDFHDGFETPENMTEDTILLSTSSIPRNLSHLIHQTSPSSTLLAKSYLHLINSTNPDPEKPVSVLPVMRDDVVASELYSKLVVGVKEYPSIAMMSPVVYTPTQYPRSDAFEVVSSIGNYIAVRPEAEVLILNSEDLADLLSVSHVNPALHKRRWFVVGGAQYEEDIQASYRGRGSIGEGSITTLAYLGGSHEDKIRSKYLETVFTDDGVAGTVYEEWLAYEAVINIHRAFAYSELSSVTTFSQEIERVFGLKQGEGREQGIFAAMFYTGNKIQDVEFIPKMDWVVEAVVNATVVDDKMEVDYEKVRTSPLTRKEVENIYELKKPTCPNPIFTVDIIEKTYIPRTSLTYTLDTLPKAVVLPVGGGVSVGVVCGEEVFRFSCVLSKYDSGDLACIATNSGEARTHHRQKRSENTTEIDANDDDEKLNASLHELEVIDAEFGGIIDSWKDLVPKVVGCYASLSGCDFCFYFLAVYNLSVTPAVCNGGCALGVTKSCTAMVSHSIKNLL